MPDTTSRPTRAQAADDDIIYLLDEMLDAPATRALSHGAFKLYVALKAEHDPKHPSRWNGYVSLSLRQAQKVMRSKRDQIARWYRSPCWRLTELPYMGRRATKDFLRWNREKFRDQPGSSGVAS